MHAFIIEDEYLIGQALQDMLERQGFTEFSFSRSEDAAVLGASGGKKIDLITADVRLLPGDGLNAVQAICEQRKIPVIFVTAYAEELRDRAPDAIVLQKPIKEEALAAAVKQALSANGEPVEA